MLKVVSGGIQTLVEDWKGREGYLGTGIGPAGAMDHFAIRAANLLVGNSLNEAGLEIAAGLFSAEFGTDAVIAVTGANFIPKLNGEPIPLWEAIRVNRGDVFHSGNSTKDTIGFREYLAIAGGVDVPLYLGSKATSVCAGFGGYKGRALRKGDILKLSKPKEKLENIVGRRFNSSYIPKYSRTWVLRAIPGPNAAPEYLSEEGMEALYTEEFRVQVMSDRVGVRLDGPKPKWAKGRVGGTHPSNVDIDHGYATGALNISGDVPIILPIESPPRGGFVCALGLIYADQWMVGQMVPGIDTVKFAFCTADEATKARKGVDGIFVEESIS